MHEQTFSLFARNRKRQRGNALWFILVVIVLIGILTAFLSRSGSNTDQSADVEQQRIKISQMIRFTKSIETTVNTLTMNGVSASDLNFSPTNADSVNCTSNSCKVFHVEGGGISYQAPPQGISSAPTSEWLITGTNNAINIGSAAPDLILMLRNVNNTYCTQINRLLNITQGPTDPTIDFTPFAGAYTATQTLDEVNGQPAGCLLSGTENIYYQVLIPR